MMNSQKAQILLNSARWKFMKNYYLARFVYLYLIRRKKIDCCFISVGRSGRTWVRTILGKYFEYTYNVPFTVNFTKNLSRKIPVIEFTHDLRFIKYLRNTKAVFLIRDPRDTVVSFYHYSTNRDKAFSGTISEYIRSKHGIRRIVKQLNDFVRYQTYPSEVLWMAYEDLQGQTQKGMTSLLEFLGVEVGKRNLVKAIKFADFKNLQKLEKAGKFKPGKLEHTKGKPSSLLVRKGKVGGYKKELNKEDIGYVEQQIQEKLQLNRYR